MKADQYLIISAGNHEVERVMELAEIYEKTADLIEERGLARGTLEDEQGRLCLLGAAHVVLYGCSSPGSAVHRDGRCELFENDLTRRLGGGSSVNWSDGMAHAGQSRELVANLREFAAVVRAEADAPAG